MAMAEALVLEPDHRAQREIDEALRSVPLDVFASGSLADALERVAEAAAIAVVIADFDVLSGAGHRPVRADLTRWLTRAIRQLRDCQAGRPERPAWWRPLPIIVTSPDVTVAAHAAALKAGADLFLSVAEAGNETILGSYVERLLRERGEPAGADGDRNGSDGRAPAIEAPRVADAFALPTDHLRSDNGRLDAARIAEVANVPLRRLASAIGVKYGTLHKTADAPAVQAALAPFANVLAMLDQIYAGDQRRIRGWLESPQRALGGRSPREALLTPGGARGVEQFVTGAWLGEPE